MKQIALWVNDLELKKAVEISKKTLGIESITGLVRYLIKQYLKKKA